MGLNKGSSWLFLRIRFPIQPPNNESTNNERQRILHGNERSRHVAPRIEEINVSKARITNVFGMALSFASLVSAAKRRPPAMTAYLPVFLPLVSDFSTTVRFCNNP